MTRTALPIFDDLIRPARLLVRHVRYGRASFGSVASARKTAGLTKLYRGVNAYLRELGVEYVLAFGTLLGWQREQRLLPHDRDVDFSAPVEAYPIIRDARDRLPRGFTLHDTSHRHGGPKLYVSCGGWEADIYFYTDKAGQMRPFIVGGNPGDTAPFPHDYFYPRQSATFLGEATFVPAQPVAILESHYGYIGANAERDPATGYYRPRQQRGS